MIRYLDNILIFILILLIPSAIVFRQNKKITCEEYEYHFVGTICGINDREIEVIVPVALDTCVCDKTLMCNY